LLRLTRHYVQLEIMDSWKAYSWFATLNERSPCVLLAFEEAGITVQTPCGNVRDPLPAVKHILDAALLRRSCGL